MDCVVMVVTCISEKRVTRGCTQQFSWAQHSCMPLTLHTHAVAMAVVAAVMHSYVTSRSTGSCCSCSAGWVWVFARNSPCCC